ncbi:MAG: hypothetical protein K2N10_06310, partial [Muribaculaceae bacterium]|nr:hypothetical protein [Muribaculaceae bacterium]
ADAAEFLRRYPRPLGYLDYWRHGIPAANILELSARLENMVAYAANSRSQREIDALNALPLLENLAILHPAANSPRLRAALMWFLPLGLPLWLLSLPFQRRLLRNIRTLA